MERHTSCRTLKRFLLLMMISLMCITWARMEFHLSAADAGTDQLITSTPMTSQYPTSTAPDANDVPHQSYPQSFFHEPGLDLYLSSAFVDTRFNETALRIFGIQHRDLKVPQFICEFPGFNITSPKAIWMLIDKDWPSWSHYFACMFGCYLPNGFDPSKVVLKSVDGAHSYTMPITPTIRTKKPKTLAICVKPMTGDYPVARLVEWFELHRAAGIENFIIYDGPALGASRFVMDYYQTIGVLKIHPFLFNMALFQYIDVPHRDMDGTSRYAAFQQMYLVAMHDCFYRYHEVYENMLFIDRDEVLLPTYNISLVSVIKEIRQRYQQGSAYLFDTAWHFEEFGLVEPPPPEILYTMRYGKSTAPTDIQRKAIMNTNHTVTFNFHSSLLVPVNTGNIVMPYERYGSIHHYRGTCADKFDPDRCRGLTNSSHVDPALFRYREELEQRVKHVMDKIQLH